VIFAARYRVGRKGKVVRPLNIVGRAIGANLSSFIFLLLPGPGAQFGGQWWPGALVYSAFFDLKMTITQSIAQE